MAFGQVPPGMMASAPPNTRPTSMPGLGMGPGQGQSPTQQGQRPLLTGGIMTGVDQQGKEQITFIFGDGFKAVETMAELVHMGMDPRIVGAVGQAFEQAADFVYSVNHGRGVPPR